MTTARDRPPEEAAEDTSFARGLRLLLTVADRGEVRADELSTLLDMPLSTVYRYLRTLGEFGFVDRHGGQFRPRPEAAHRHRRHVSSERLIRHADAALRMLVHETGETAVVVRRIGLSCVCLHQIECDAALRVTFEPGDDVAAVRRGAGSGPARLRAARRARGGPRPGPPADHRRDADRGRSSAPASGRS